MIKIVALVFTLLISSAAADTPDMTMVPEAILMEGLDMVTVCVATERIGIAALRMVVEKERREPSQDSPEIITNAIEDAKQLAASANDYAAIGNSIVKTLVEYYKKDRDVLFAHSRELTSDTITDLSDRLASFETYEEFLDKFGTPMNNCNRVTESFKKQIDSLIKGLEDK